MGFRLVVVVVLWAGAAAAQAPAPDEAPDALVDEQDASVPADPAEEAPDAQAPPTASPTEEPSEEPTAEPSGQGDGDPVQTEDAPAPTDAPEPLPPPPEGLSPLLTALAQVVAGTLFIGASRGVCLALMPCWLALSYVGGLGSLLLNVYQLVVTAAAPGALMTWLGNGLSNRSSGLIPMVGTTLVVMTGCTVLNAFGFVGTFFVATVFAMSLGQILSSFIGLYALLVPVALFAAAFLLPIPMDILAGVLASSLGAYAYSSLNRVKQPPPGWEMPELVKNGAPDAEPMAKRWGPPPALADRGMAY
jgi:hypothetical protein